MDKDALIAQYNNLFTHLIEHKKHLWHIPVANATIIGILIGLAFSLPEVHWTVREMILIIGASLSCALLSKVIKHRYFGYIWSKSLSKIEEYLGLKQVQLFTKYGEADYWYSQSPKRRLEEQSSDNMVVNCMWVVFILLTGLLIAVPILAVKGIL